MSCASKWIETTHPEHTGAERYEYQAFASQASFHRVDVIPQLLYGTQKVQGKRKGQALGAPEPTVVPIVGVRRGCGMKSIDPPSYRISLIGNAALHATFVKAI